MKIAVIGSGGREHAIAWKLSTHTNPDDIWVIPGNGGTKNNVPLNMSDFKEVKRFCLQRGIELVVVGPEQPLVDGIVNYFQDTDVKVFGPDKKAARLEGSKIWAKQFMQKYDVATANFWLFKNESETRDFIASMNGDLVIKYDGLAAGKGVFVCSSIAEAHRALDEIKRSYGSTARFLIERKLKGQEISIIGITDGQHIKMLLPSQDHKPIYNGDRGPNTGGMGAYSPVPFCDDALMNAIIKKAVEPTLEGIRAEKLNFRGVIYFGLMITEDGPKVLEYNVRLGDPETEVIFPALKSELLQLVLSSFNGTLKDFPIEFNAGYYVDVVLASGGYPGSYEKDYQITGFDKLNSDTMVFHAGTRKVENKIVTAGGRVLNIVTRGNDLESAIDNAYSECKKIHFEKMYYRTDIGMKGLSR